MSFVRLPVGPHVGVGSVVGGDSIWTAAPNTDHIFGVIRSTPAIDPEDNVLRAPIIFGGLAYATASREIPAAGGYFNVESGGVYVDPLSDRSFKILPSPAGTVTAAGALVAIEF